MVVQNSTRKIKHRRPGFEPCSGHVGFVVDEVPLGQVSSEYFRFRWKFAFHRLLHNHHHLSSGAGTIGQALAAVPSGNSLTPREKKIPVIKDSSNIEFKRIKPFEICVQHICLCTHINSRIFDPRTVIASHHKKST
jgi:hypothetical protein